MTDIHNCAKIVRQNYDNVQKSEDISEQNKADIRDFISYMEDRELSESRKMRYLPSAKKILVHNNYRLKTASEDQKERNIDRSNIYVRGKIDICYASITNYVS